MCPLSSQVTAGPHNIPYKRSTSKIRNNFQISGQPSSNNIMVARKEYLTSHTKPSRFSPQKSRFRRSPQLTAHRLRLLLQFRTSGQDQLIPQSSMAMFRFFDLPVELQLLVFGNVSADHEVVHSELGRHINNLVSITHPGAQRLTVVEFQHRLDIPDLMVSKKFLKEAIQSYAKSGSIKVLSAKELFAQKQDLIQNPGSNDPFAGQIKKTLLTEARQFWITHNLSPVGLGLPLSPPIWAPRLQSLDLEVYGGVYWTVENGQDRFINIYSALFMPFDTQRLTEAELNEVVKQKKFRNGVSSFTNNLLSDLDSPWFNRVRPEFWTHEWPGHFHFLIKVRCLLLTDSAELEGVILTCKFDAASLALLSISRQDCGPDILEEW